MIIEHKENISSNFEGTIIDIETIGEFLNQYHDSRRYQDIQMVIFGCVDSRSLQIICARGMRALEELRERAEKIIESLEEPFYAYNTGFERSVLFYGLGREVDFARELQEGYESKAFCCSSLGIYHYDDPFFDNGYLCMKAWEIGDFDRAIAHNRACLLKEKDILIKRGFRTPDKLRFIKRE